MTNAAYFLALFAEGIPPENPPRSLATIHAVATSRAEALRLAPSWPPIEVGGIGLIEISALSPKQTRIVFEVPGFIVTCRYEEELATLAIFGDGLIIGERL